MKAVALVSQKVNSELLQWQFDKIMSAIAYDLELTIIFFNDGLMQIETNKIWRCLDLYGIDQVFYFSQTKGKFKKPLFNIETIDESKLKTIISKAEIIL
jgi:sulfur relay (sulfurtransferase) DsrF/TusC family protein